MNNSRFKTIRTTTPGIWCVSEYINTELSRLHRCEISFNLSLMLILCELSPALRQMGTLLNGVCSRATGDSGSPTGNGIMLCVLTWYVVHMSRVMRKPTFCICENKDADQLRGNREADQRLCFRYIDSTIPLLSKSEISSL